MSTTKLAGPTRDAMMRTTLGCLLLTCLLVAGCQRNPAPAPGGGASAGAPSGSAAAPATQDSERTWVGLLPCRDCQGIDTRLVLRTAAGRRDYLMTETYLGGSGKNSFNRSGSWIESQAMVDGETVTTYVLDPGQADQRFELKADGALEMLEADGRAPAGAIDYRLQRL